MNFEELDKLSLSDVLLVISSHLERLKQDDTNSYLLKVYRQIRWAHATESEIEEYIRKNATRDQPFWRNLTLKRQRKAREFLRQFKG